MTVNYRVILWHWWQFLTYWGTQIMIFVKVRWQLESDNGQFLQSLKMKRYGVPLLGRGQAFLVPPFFWSAVSKNWVKRRPNCRFQWSSTHLLHFYRLGHGEWQWMKMKENVGHWRALKENEEGHWMTMSDNATLLRIKGRVLFCVQTGVTHLLFQIAPQKSFCVKLFLCVWPAFYFGWPWRTPCLTLVNED